MLIKKFNLIIFSIFTLLVGCKNNTQRSEQFVNQYNKKTLESKNSIIYNTYAKLYSEKIPKEYLIDIIIELTIKKEEYKNPFGLKIITKNIADLLLNEDVYDLVNSGAIINLKYKSFDNYFVEEITLNKQILDEISNIKIFESKKPLTNQQVELIRHLDKINEYLPYLNTDDRSKLLKVELDQWNNIDCYVEYDGDYEVFSKYLFKERMLYNKYIASIIERKKQFGIISITYKFQKSNGQKMGDYMVKP